jgi:putative membrane protein
MVNWLEYCNLRPRIAFGNVMSMSSSAPSSLNSRRWALLSGKARLVVVILVILHQVGVVGLHLPETRGWFQPLIPYNLLFSVAVLLLFHRYWTLRFAIFCFVIFWAGYLVELLGVSTGVIFGPYHYGGALGIKVGEVPPMIGINWLMLVYTTGLLARELSGNIWMRATLAAAAMVLLDLVIEPMAIRYDFWTWETDQGQIPLQNFAAWFGISWVMSYAFQVQPDRKQNPIAIPLYLIQLFFFLTFWVVDQFGVS